MRVYYCNNDGLESCRSSHDSRGTTPGAPPPGAPSPGHHPGGTAPRAPPPSTVEAAVAAVLALIAGLVEGTQCAQGLDGVWAFSMLKYIFDA